MSTKTKTADQFSWPPKESEQKFPEFLQQRVDQFFNERVEKTWSGRHIMRGLAQTESSIDVSHNDYLSIGGHPSIVDAQVRCLLNNENGKVKGSIFLHGNNVHRQFELAMAEFLQAEDVLLCQSGWCANTGLIQSIANKDTPVYIDIIAHMSLWEGVQSAGAKAHPMRHNDERHLEHLIKQYGQGVIVIDSVYSTNGDVCPIEEIVAIAEKYGCILIVDESHSLGTHGKYGEGMVASLGLADKVHYRTASLAKAFPGRGGIIACSSRHREYFIFESKPAIFSSTLLPHDIEAYLAMLKIVRQESWRRVKLHRNADYIRTELSNMGYNLEASKSQIVSIESGTEQQTIILRDALEKNGIFGSIFCAPATATNRALLRLSINAGLNQNQVEHIVKACYDVRDEVGMKNWASTLRKEKDIRKANPAVLNTMKKLKSEVNTIGNSSCTIYRLNPRNTKDANFATNSTN